MSENLPPLGPSAVLRWHAVEPLLPDRGSCLEIGAGQGGFAARLDRRYRYLGVEPDPASHAVASQRVQLGEVLLGSYEDVDPSASFDLVCAFEVLEHIEDDVSALAEWASHVEPGGLLLVSVPAGSDRMGPADHAVGHHRRYDPADLMALFRSAGLCEVGARRFGAPLGYLLEAARNRLAARDDQASESIEDRTAKSGRWFQPSSQLAGVAVAVAATPFAMLQQVVPGGPGLLVWGRRP